MYRSSVQLRFDYVKQVQYRNTEFTRMLTIPTELKTSVTDFLTSVELTP